ncbi:hypothetical protein [Stutzerimonas nosocomialis]|uniref:hypothetical protein n=1 Tax=Stutzerimonas nosocomialis TaxID=1056496 RepID=UPI00188448C8|nr:hypothetical protein [Stutzerimonas nosocomialis]
MGEPQAKIPLISSPFGFGNIPYHSCNTKKGITMFFRLLGTAALFALITGCSNYQYKAYAANIDDPAVKVLDLADGTPDAPIVYFDTVQFRALGVPYHRLLLAVQADGKFLPDAGRYSLLNFAGYQAVRLTPGRHSLEWCWVSMNKLGTGGGMCGLGVNGLELEAGKRYLVTWADTSNIKGPPKRERMEITVTSFILDRDTKQQRGSLEATRGKGFAVFHPTPMCRRNGWVR